MEGARVFPVRVLGGSTVVLLSTDEVAEAAEQGRLMVAPQLGPEAAGSSPEGRASLFEALEQIGRSVPDDVWAAIPADLSENHDHYAWGAPKR